MTEREHPTFDQFREWYGPVKTAYERCADSMVYLIGIIDKRVNAGETNLFHGIYVMLCCSR